ncbi:MAG: lysophospholipid acyltransferase family protein [Bacteriovoracaceae bacterium]
MNKNLLNIITNLAYLILRLLNSSYRYRFVGLENLKHAKNNSPHKSFILASWHQNLLGGILSQKENLKYLSGMASKSKDGEVIARVATKLGIQVVRGSSRSNSGVDKGGKQAKDKMAEYMLQGVSAALTIDGPKGPAKKTKAGALDLSRKTNSHIIPYFVVGQKYWEFNSWDKFRIPKPFTKIVVFYGHPFKVEEDVRGEAFNLKAQEFNKKMDMSEKEALECLSKWDSLEKVNFWPSF